MKNKEINKIPGFQPRSVLLLALLFAYPFTIHSAIIKGYTVTALLVFLSIPVLIFTRRWAGRLLLGLASAGTVVFLSSVISNIGQLLLYLMPILINAGLAVFFGQTLLTGRTPIITKVSILFRGKLKPEVVSYTRHVTQMWTLFFILLVVELLMLALIAPIEIWSLFANILNYVFAVLLFTGEYLFRIRYLGDLEHPSFTQFVRKLSQVKFSELNK